MLGEGLLRNRKRLPWSGYEIIVLIFVAITAFGLLKGAGVGLVAVLVFFVVRLSRVDPVDFRFTLRSTNCLRPRAIPDRAILAQEAD